MTARGKGGRKAPRSAVVEAWVSSALDGGLAFVRTTYADALKSGPIAVYAEETPPIIAALAQYHRRLRAHPAPLLAAIERRMGSHGATHAVKGARGLALVTILRGRT